MHVYAAGSVPITFEQTVTFVPKVCLWPDAQVGQSNALTQKDEGMESVSVVCFQAVP